MISHQHRCIFVHVPKVAGQSVELYFLQDLGIDWKDRAPLLLRPNDDPKMGPPYLAHLRLNEYVELGYIDQRSFDQYFKFTLVRDPWSRVHSFYKYEGFNQRYSFKSFVTRVLPKLIRQKAWFYGPQYPYVYDANGQTSIDFIGRFENISEDFAKVCTRLNLEDHKLPYRNKSQGKRRWGRKRFLYHLAMWPINAFPLVGDRIRSSHYRDYYDDELVQRVAELYAQDVEAFSYQY